MPALPDQSQPAVLRHRLDRLVARGEVATVSAITVFELRYGIAKSGRVASNTQRTDLFLATTRPLPFDSEDARIAGIIRHELEGRGTPIGPYDVLIAPQAVRHGLTLVTANVREISRVEGLRWEDWSD